MTKELPRSELYDITAHLGDKIARDLMEAMQLIDVPQQRALLAYAFAQFAARVSTEIIVECHLADTGKPIDPDKALLTLLWQIYNG